LKERDDITFLFVGGGSELSKVKEFARTNRLETVRWLPYQPQSELAAMLSAADLSVVIMGEPFPGIVHPCKIYNIMGVGAPFLYVGPKASHVVDIISGLADQQQASWATHGQVELVVRAISERADAFLANQSRVARFDSGSAPTLSQFISEIESTGGAAISVRSPNVREGLMANEVVPNGRASDTA
jgi:hypothetical protein